jgi:hypothetical protein
MSSRLPALNITHVPAMTNKDPSTMEDERSANRNSDSPKYIRDKYDMFISEANLLHPHLQETTDLLSDTPLSPSHKVACNTNGLMVSSINLYKVLVDI